MRKTKTIKKLPYLALAGIAATSSLSAFLAPNNASAATSRHDYSEFPSTLSEDWSYTDIYGTSEMQVEVVQSSDQDNSTAVGTKSTKGSGLVMGIPYKTRLGVLMGDQSFSVLLTGTTSKDANGNPLDILVRLSDIRQPSGTTQFPDRRFGITGSDGQPVNFYYTAMGLTYDISLKWCVKGSYNQSNNDCNAANISKVNSYIYDIDVADSTLPEYITINNGDTDFYYDNTYLTARGSGLAPRSAPHSDNFRSAALSLTQNLSDATISMSVGGNGGAIDQMFVTPAQYAMTASPAKRVDKTSAKVGDYVNYTFTQSIPANYDLTKSSLFGELASNYSNITADTRYSALALVDTLPSDLEIVRSSDIVAPSGFTASVSGNRVTYTAAVANESIYGKTHTFTIRARVKASGAGKTIANTGTTSHTGRSGARNANSNTVNTKIANRYTVTEKFIDVETGEEIVEAIKTSYNEGDKIKLKGLKDEDIPEGYLRVEVSNTINGATVTKNEVQEYQFRRIKVVEELKENPNTSDATLGIVGIASIASALLGGIFFISRKRR